MENDYNSPSPKLYWQETQSVTWIFASSSPFDCQATAAVADHIPSLNFLPPAAAFVFPVSTAQRSSKLIAL